MLINLVRIIPRSLLSRLVGRLVHIRLPPLFANMVVGAFTRWFRIDLSQAVVPSGGFRSIGELFTRELLPGARPLPSAQSDGSEERLLSPVDGVLRSAQLIDGRSLEVKGLEFTPVELLGGDELATRFQAGAVFNYYLAPPDYHHIHSPVSGRIVKSRYVPGDLWPVNDWALKSIPRLFCKNERVVTFIESAHGLVAVVMVGALNVGRISVTYDDWLTNSGDLPTQLERTYVPEIPVQLGQKLGTFHMGSSVLVLIEKVPAWLPEEAKQFGKVRYGQSLRET